MAKLTINRGSTANDGTGDNLRDGANKVNLNFTEIYTAIGDGSTVDGTIKVADDSSTVMTLSANGETIRLLGGTGITSTISGNDLTLAVDGTVLSSSAVSTLTNKSIALSGNTITGTTAEFNTALTDNDFATLAGTEALTNKTVDIGSNTITGTALTITGDDSSATSLSIGDNILFTGGSGITTSISGNEITFATDGAVVTETSTDTLTNKTINGPDNTLTNIANGSLANSAVTLGGTSVSLGATAATVTNLALTGTSGISGTGAVDTTSSGNKLRFDFANVGSLPAAATYEGMFAYDIGGNTPYVADAGGWVKLLSENSSIADISNVGSIASITNGQVLVWNSAGGRFDPGNAGGFSAGSDLDQANATVQDAAYFSFRSDSNTPTKTLTVTVATQTSEHYYNGQGSSNKYVIDGDQGPFLMLSPGIYRFDQSDSSNTGHPLRFYKDADRNELYSYNVTTNGTPGSSGAYTQIEVNRLTHEVLYYQCTAHALMGHGLQIIGYNGPGGKTTFTGDASTTVFTLSQINRNEYDILVFINGICLVPEDDYTVSGTNLTFTTAPAASAEITIRYIG
jgi:hypothetical protein